jgi:hypothetical protein
MSGWNINFNGSGVNAHFGTGDNHMNVGASNKRQLTSFFETVQQSIPTDAPPEVSDVMSNIEQYALSSAGSASEGDESKSYIQTQLERLRPYSPYASKMLKGIVAGTTTYYSTLEQQYPSVAALMAFLRAINED